MEIGEFVMPNLQTIQDYVTLFKDIFTGISALIVALVAIIGLRTWKIQLKGKNEYELAQKFLRATYRVREALNSVRNPFETSSEQSQAMKEASIEEVNNQNQPSSALCQRAVYQRRWNKVVDSFNEFDSLSLEAETLWGSEVKEIIKPLSQCTSRLHITISRYLETLTGKLPYSPEFEKEKMKIMYAIPDASAEDPFNDEIGHAINQIEDFIKPRLKL